MIEIRPPRDVAEIKQIETIQYSAWGERNVTPFNTLKAWMHTGGVVLGAFNGPQMVGFVAGFLGKVGGQWAQWSHIAAVLPDYRRQGIGRDLKFAQQAAAQAQGIHRIAWTFDPMRRANALFNLNTLQATGVMLHQEHYGEMEDALNIGLLSDRFEIHWDSKGRQPKPHGNHPPAQMMLSYDRARPTRDIPATFDAVTYGIAAPADVDTLREQSPDQVRAWYMALRDAMQPLFQTGYTLTSVYTPPEDDTHFVYIMQQAPIWYLYVLQTADDSLYTGITTQLEARLKAHNAGRGAKYTASRLPVTLLAAWQTYGRSRASQLEHQFKRRNRADKLGIIQSGANFNDARRIH